CQQYENFTI
nr:immunoglobulin light chain junction region [Macaca mulatta]